MNNVSINFTIHEDTVTGTPSNPIIDLLSHFFITRDNEREDIQTSIASLFTLLDIAIVLRPMFLDFMHSTTNNFPVHQLERNDNCNIRIGSQRYDTTPKKFTNCVICTQDYVPSSNVALLPCAHAFHPVCIREWAHYNPVCPLCKIPIEVVTKENVVYK